ncbi:DUF3077 domain-containing protein [Pseudomonas capsici]|uniref:DUF6124 family protein n=1 Tax=Pseudomonas capsici TaxID=2810614 RepID=UPI0021F1BA9B|nr:DUF3077 domain-containing protein [Pseudomonas capsici]MCV4291393.1 DUF3077 domain-containing protein [Pseudomonas capsici]
MIGTIPSPPRDIATSLFTVKPGVNIEDALILASEYLTCAAATAHETADNSTKEYRPLARAVAHQIEAALALVEASVVGLEERVNTALRVD